MYDVALCYRRHLLEMDLSLSSERVHEISDKVFANACCAVNVMKRLFLIEDIIDSLKVRQCKC